MDTTVKVHGIDVTLIDANQYVASRSVQPLDLPPGLTPLRIATYSCPGSVLFLFEGPHTDPKSPFSKTPNRIFRYLHCGGKSCYCVCATSAHVCNALTPRSVPTDFRASPQHVLHPSMSYPTPPSSRPMVRASSSTSQGSSSQPPNPLPGRTLKRLDAIYLDTTYLSPSYCFPAQELVISACAELVRERIVGGDETALWRADGREAERKGMKGWLKGDGTGVKKEEDGVKEDKEMERMMQLGEGEERESQTPMPALDEDGEMDGVLNGDEPLELERLPEETDDAVMEDGGDEEAWLAVHADETQAGETQQGDDSQAWAGQHADESTYCGEGTRVDGASPPPTHNQPADAAAGVKEEDGIKEEQLAGQPLLDKATDAGSEEADFKAEGAEEKPDIKPKAERLLVLVGTYSIGKER